jgi:hypothetical protein
MEWHRSTHYVCQRHTASCSDSNDLKSETIPFAFGKLTLGAATTDSAGNYQLSLTSVGTSQVILEATYAGDAQHWPAYARVGP